MLRIAVFILLITYATPEWSQADVPPMDLPVKEAKQQRTKTKSVGVREDGTRKVRKSSKKRKSGNKGKKYHAKKREKRQGLAMIWDAITDFCNAK